MITKEMIIDNADLIAVVLQCALDVQKDRDESEHTKRCAKIVAFEDIMNLFEEGRK